MLRIRNNCFFKSNIICLWIYAIINLTLYSLNPSILSAFLPFIITGFAMTIILMLAKFRYMPYLILISHAIRILQLANFFLSPGKYSYIPYPYGDWRMDLVLSFYGKLFYSKFYGILLILGLFIGILLELISFRILRKLNHYSIKPH